ncbi:hypothetical protein SAMN05660462_03039 [Proteiniborus ethanoligenes]|uniref:Uncharacterized protein n=1 Tax=Proteiniborus ethanoligenes TaxID=415015 RepID=A0A1H3SQW0_9FIRM|nr:hypothetical protein [Proteiniborus ethanoligenes]SDZ40068.1 hypothetical protein SAMN05660462_03039 [Proteiniborus ethanoligenes]
MIEKIIKAETLKLGNKVIGKLIIKRYSGPEGIYDIEFNSSQGVAIPTLLTDRINLMHVQYKERQKRSKKCIYGHAFEDYIVFEVWYDVYEKFYDEIKRLLRIDPLILDKNSRILSFS